MIKTMTRAAVAVGFLELFLLSSVPLLHKMRLWAPEGTQVATDQTQAAAVNTDALRNAAQNPVAALISVPIQDNFNFNNSPGDRTQNVLNIQPVIPITVSKNWNLIVRWITPIIYQPLPIPQASGPPTLTTGVYGLGDMNPTFFISPKKSKVIWGIGPTLGISHGNQYDVSGTGKIQRGPLGGCAGAAQAVDDWVSCKQPVVICRPFRFQ